MLQLLGSHIVGHDLVTEQQQQFAMKWWGQMQWALFFKCWVSSQLLILFYLKQVFFKLLYREHGSKLWKCIAFLILDALNDPPSVLWLCCCSGTHPRLPLSDPVGCSTLGFPVLPYLLQFAQTHVHWVGDGIQPSHPLSSPSPAFSLSQHQGLFQWVSSSHQVAKALEFQLQHQSFQWIFRTDFL